ncbi:MAG: formylglycine-generating enzyme family protein [Prevotellaceae bacterium]|jgi:formylglycine-generating enzyme required for sulfatase activity|nr:formylglycine-generating enzyme family protein [Prevotellaceae bacterium]
MKKNYFRFVAYAAIAASLVFAACSKDENKNETPEPDKTGKLTFTDGIDLIFVEGGTYTQGSDGLIVRNEAPQHSVTLSDFYLGKYEITQKQYKDVTGRLPEIEPTATDGLGDKYPVYYVTYADAQEFISKLNEKSGKHYRLPTEAEWEYAARGGKKSKGFIYSGSNDPNDVTKYYGTAGNSWPVDDPALKPNELGIYNLTGNAYEWTSDWYGEYSANAQTNPTGPASGTERVARGGTYINVPTGLRVAARYHYEPDAQEKFIGFRIAHSEEN